jgi:hypothetical protein
VLIRGDKISSNKKYTEKVQLKRSIELILLRISSTRLNILCNFKVEYHRSLSVTSR